MPSSYPAGLDSLANPAASDTLDSLTVPHAEQHDKANDAIEAIQATLGTNPQGVAPSVRSRLEGLETMASAQAAIATTQAGIATTQAGVATTQAGVATTQASAAASSAVSASASAAAAAAVFDSFDDRYLGPKATAPSVDNDGNTLLIGALYFDTALTDMRVWTGSTWISAADAVSEWSGPVSIDTSSTSAGLRVTQRGTGNALLVEDSANPDSTPFVVNGSGQVSFGYTSQPFFITGVVPNVASLGTSNTSGQLATVRYSADAAGTWVHLGKSRGELGNQGLVASGDAIGIVDFSASDGAIFTTAARITAAVDGTPGTNDMPGRLVFSTTADGAASPTERMRITSAGDINVATPYAQIYGSAGNGNWHIRGKYNTSAPFDNELLLSSNYDPAAGTIDSSARGTAMLSVDARNGSGVVRILTSAANNTAPSERVIIDGNGNVGIGTTSPAQRLTVAGDAELRNDGVTQPTLHFTSQDGTTNVWQIDAQVSNATNAQLQFINNGTERMRINNAGKVGINATTDIGITTPSMLEVNNGVFRGITVGRSTADTSGSSIHLAKSRGAIYGARGVVGSGDQLGSIGFWGDDGASMIPGALIVAQVDGTPGTNDLPTRLQFHTTPDGSASNVERMRIGGSGLITGTGTSLGAWTAYTPTLGGTGWAIGNGTVVAAYCQIGKIVFFRAKITMGTTSTFGSAAMQVGLPVTANSSFTPSVQVEMVDTSASKAYTGLSRVGSTTTVEIRSIVSGTNGEVTPVISTAPYTWASTDYVLISGTYEAA